MFDRNPDPSPKQRPEDDTTKRKNNKKRDQKK
jgi:hypothetical protein